MISVRDFRPPNHVPCTKCNACISHSNASKLAMLPSQMIPKQPCQCNPSWLLDAKHAILIFSTHSSSVFMPSYAFKWIFLIFISCLSFLKASKLYERCKHMKKKASRNHFSIKPLYAYSIYFLLSKQRQFSYLYITHAQKKQGSPNSNILD